LRLSQPCLGRVTASIIEYCGTPRFQFVQYVKICSLYGVGFYYIPGTDMCIKIGGWVRAEYGWGQNGNFA
jgi:hypothetical protein